jgi:thiol-disulfide isomerase/thioredoxin
MTTEAAARRLGCPQGTVLSRLSRARERLRERLTRRGLAAPAGLLAAAPAPDAARGAVPAALIDSAIRVAMRLAVDRTTAGVVPAPVAALTEGVLRAMFLTRLKMATLALIVLGLATTGAGSLVYPDREEGADRAAVRKEVEQVEISPAQRYEALVQEYKDFRKWLDQSRDKLKTEDERQSLFRKNWPLEDRFTGRFLDLARGRPDDPVAFDALAWVVAFGYTSADSDVAAELLARDHASNPRLWPLCQEMARGPITLARGVLLRAILEHGPDRTLRGRAGFALAAFRRDEADFARLLGAGLSPWQAQFLTPERLGKFRALDPAQLTREAQSLLELVLRDYPDVRPVRLNPAPDHAWDARTLDKKSQDAEVADRTLGELARPLLDELRRLEVGRPAPEIEGEDAEGKAFRLGDYRGKVVLLTFSGNWCGPCRSMYPHERELVKRYAGRPFALLSVNTDEERETLRESIKSGEITWRCWWEPGGAGGATPARWNVHSWPTIYILDHEGVIRNKSVGFIGTEKSGPGLERAIDPLLAEIEQGAASTRAGKVEAPAR